MQYNTQKDKLRLPEYGRHIQEMIDYCVSLPDREERNACAYTIASIMGRLFFDSTPDNNRFSNPEINRKIWDQMNIMSQFRLDVDFPFPVITEENAKLQPEKVEYSRSPVKLRHYGRIIQDMAEAVADMPEGPDREEAACLLAIQMKKQLFLHNKEAVDDMIVTRDLYNYTDGRVNVSPDVLSSCIFVDAPSEPQPTAGKKKKKKKNNQQ